MSNLRRYRNVRVLLVEDNPVDVEAVLRSFRKHGLENEVYVAKDALDALDILRGRRVPEPYIILLDLNLPRMSGVEFLAELRADEVLRSSIVFVLTTSNADEDRLASYGHHVAGYVVKGAAGVDYEDLTRMLEAYWAIVEFPPETAHG